MLVGFDLSGIVRKKVPGAVSAGRVQSPALRLIVEREQQIEKFASKFTYKVVGDFGFPATLNKSFDSEEEVKAFLEKLINAEYLVSAVDHTPGTRKPAPPFTPASMQIEANSRLGYSTRVTMNAAQALYQAGLIT
jgi:DNA topoisomerase-1